MVVDLFCVGLVAFFCIYSLFVPLFGIIVGAVLMNIGVSPSSRRVGKVCLILGFVSIAFYFLLFVLALLVGTLPFFQDFGAYY